MIDFKTDLQDIEKLRIAGAPDTLGAEIAMLVGIVHAKIKGASEEEGDLFRMRMQHILEDGSPVWDAPDLPGETTVMKIPRK